MLNWNDIQGQDRAKKVLESSVESGRIHHAYLMVGPLGVGKRATALALAAALNCTGNSGSGFQPACGQCPSCRKVEGMQHPDIRVIEAEGRSIKIDQVRSVQKAAATRPYEGDYQVIIIDDCHKMTEEAANALLKTLEEPPESMKLLLISHQPASLLDTIRSRCQLLRFAPLSSSIVSSILSHELSDMAPDQLQVAAGYGEGSVGRAKDLAESGLIAERAELIRTILNTDAKHTATLSTAAESLSKDRSLFGTKLEILKVFLRDVALLQAVPDHPERIINQDLSELAQTWGREVSADDVLNRINLVSRAQHLLERNVNPMMIAEDLLMDLARR